MLKYLLPLVLLATPALAQSRVDPRIVDQLVQALSAQVAYQQAELRAKIEDVGKMLERLCAKVVVQREPLPECKKEGGPEPAVK